VTLFEGPRVIKAKKTRLVPIPGSGKVVTFYETFSILFPYDFLQEVACIISLCGKTRNGGWSKAGLSQTRMGIN
jgi:hypothetical protein